MMVLIAGQGQVILVAGLGKVVQEQECKVSVVLYEQEAFVVLYESEKFVSSKLLCPTHQTEGKILASLLYYQGRLQVGHS